MTRGEIIHRIKQVKIMAIVRLKQQDEVASLLQALTEGGIEILEITSNTPGFEIEISKARSMFPHLLIGAGTILNAALAQRAVDAGAQFLVTPNVNLEVIEIAHNNEIPVLMGAMTPSEIWNATEHGADLIKLFPAGNLGTSYYKSVKSVFDKVDFIAVGGINASNLNEWLTAGITGIGLGSALTKTEKVTDLKNKISEFMQHLKE